jgi:hypothetical protein
VTPSRVVGQRPGELDSHLGAREPMHFDGAHAFSLSNSCQSTCKKALGTDVDRSQVRVILRLLCTFVKYGAKQWSYMLPSVVYYKYMKVPRGILSSSFRSSRH